MKPRLGILDFRPVEYHALIYQLLDKRERLDIDVLYLEELSPQAERDSDLLSGYRYRFLPSRNDHIMAPLRSIPLLLKWIREHDAVVIYGYSDPIMLTASTLSRGLRVPYLLRGDSQPRGQTTGIRRHIRNMVADSVVSASHGCLSIGKLNEAFYRDHGARRIIFAPYPVDDGRFAAETSFDRGELLDQWGLQHDLPVVVFCGSLTPRKRPLDLSSSLRLLPQEVNSIFIGDGMLSDQVKASLHPGRGVVTGFIRQREVHRYFRAADVLVLPSEFEPWGLVVNEAMTAGAIPVVSDRVGAGPDLVQDVGEIYPCGDIPALTAALQRALARTHDPESRIRIRERVQHFSLDRAAQGFEEATALK